MPESCRDPDSGRFLTGNSGGPGRTKGSRNRLGQAFLQDLLADWQEHGSAVLEMVRKQKPEVYLKEMAFIVPRDLNLSISSVDDMTDDQIMARLRELEVELKPVIGGFS